MSDTKPDSSATHDLSKMRKEYAPAQPDAASFGDDPIAQFRGWFSAAAGAGVGEPNAMALATSTPDGIPSVRFVLLKDASDEGFSFFTNYGSRKAAELAANPNASAAFYWEPLERQVRIYGTVAKLSTAESDEYFSVRPRGAQIAASVSTQSAALPDRVALERAYAEFDASHPGQIARPDHWGGFRLRPQTIEFWQGSANRLHLRVLYQRGAASGTNWVKSELFP